MASFAPSAASPWNGLFLAAVNGTPPRIRPVRVVTLSHSREHGADCQACDEAHPQIDVIERTIAFAGELSAEDTECLLVIADKCPVHRTLHNKLEVRTALGQL